MQKIPRNFEIFLVEDDAPLLTALTRVLTTAGFCVRGWADAESMLVELTNMAGTSREVAVLMDVNLGHLNGIDAQKLIRQLDANIPVIFMSAYHDAQNVNQAWRDGASNFIFKPFTPKELIGIIEEAIENKYPSPPISSNSDNQNLGNNISARYSSDLAKSLTPRQKQVLALVATGCTHQQIAQQIGISARTVKLHRAALMARLGTKNVTDLVRFYEANKQVLGPVERLSQGHF